VCGGIYDWSTGLIFKGGRYFDPTLGLWLALGPLVVVQSWRGRKRKQRGTRWYVLVLLVVCIEGILTACGGGVSGPDPTPEMCIDLPFDSPQIKSFDATLGEVDIGAWDYPRVDLGHPSGRTGNPPGIIFKAVVVVPEGISGHLQFAQVGTVLNKWRVQANKCCQRGSEGHWRTDADPYPMLAEGLSYDNLYDPNRPDYERENSRYVNTKDGKDSIFVTMATDDSPGEQLSPLGYVSEQVTVNEQYEMYLMWKPDGGSEMVLGVMDWGWSAKVKREQLSDGRWKNELLDSNAWKNSWRCATEKRETTSNLLDLGTSCMECK
jgi:hypothetical protein